VVCGTLGESGAVRRIPGYDPARAGSRSFSLIINAVHGQILCRSGRTKEAVAQFQKTLDLERNFPLATSFLVLTLVHDGKNDEAVKELEQAFGLRRNRRSIEACLPMCTRKPAESKRPEKILGDVIQEARRTARPGWTLPESTPALGEQDHAFATLEMAFQRRDSRMTMLLNDEALMPLRSDPRLSDLVRRVGLPRHD